jgi:hypothetical protein
VSVTIEIDRGGWEFSDTTLGIEPLLKALEVNVLHGPLALAWRNELVALFVFIPKANPA